MKVEKISKMALYICVGIILVCFALFFLIGYNNQVGDYNEPRLTNLIMWLMYLMALATAVLVIWSVIRGVQNAKGTGAGSATGVPGRKIAIFTICLLILSFIIGIVFGMGAEDYTAADGTVTTAGWVTVVDAFCVSIGIMFIAAAAAVAVSMTGVMTKSASK